MLVTVGVDEIVSDGNTVTDRFVRKVKTAIHAKRFEDALSHGLLKGRSELLFDDVTGQVKRAIRVGPDRSGLVDLT